jgi:hypothetical protein
MKSKIIGWNFQLSGICIIMLTLITIGLSGCTTIKPITPPSSSSVPLDKKYPAAVLVGSETDLSDNTVRNSSGPLPAEKPIYFSVRSFGGFGANELTVKLDRIEQTTVDSAETTLVYHNTLIIDTRKHDVLGTLPNLTPGNYQLTIYRKEEDIAARKFMVK